MTTITPKAARESKGYTVPQAARAAGVSPNTVYSLERGESINLGNLVKIASALGVRAADLFRGMAYHQQPKGSENEKGL